MCVVSNIGTSWSQQPWQPTPFPTPAVVPQDWKPTKAEFDALKAEIVELRKLLVAAKRFDEATGQPNCEMDEKVALIRRFAEMVGISMDDVFGNASEPDGHDPAADTSAQT